MFFVFSITTFYNWSMPVPNILKSPANESPKNPHGHTMWYPKDLNRVLCVSRCLVFLSTATQASLHPTYLNWTSQSDTVAGDRPGNSWHHSSGKIMSSQRLEIGRQACVDWRCVYVCVCVCLCLSLLLKYREIALERDKENSLNFKLQIAPVWSTPSRIWL